MRLRRFSSLHTNAFEVIEAMIKRHYGVSTLPIMSTGATDMAYLRVRGLQCFGLGPMIDSKDGRKGFGAHSDPEQILEAAVYKFVHFNHDLVVSLAGKQR